MATRHKRQHDEIIELAEQILAAAGQDRLVDAHDLATLRFRLARRINEHCEDEGNAVREAVNAGHIRRDVAASFARDLMIWRTDLAACNGKWTPAAVAADPAGFRRCFGGMLVRLRDYVQREERDVLAMLTDAPPAGRQAPLHPAW